MTDAIDTLMAEHRIIEKALEALETAASRDLGASFYARALDFLQEFADARHHGKEEERLFPALERHGIPREMGPTGVLLEEHVAGRAHVRRMREQLRAGDVAALRRESLDYIALLRDHIRKEDEVLFAMARAALTPDEARLLASEFEAADAAATPRERYGAVAEGLLGEARRA
jgi:hemerythrin-like domain-containing protein